MKGTNRSYRKGGNLIKVLLPVASIALALAVQALVPNASAHPNAKQPYFTYFLAALLGGYLVFLAVSLASESLRKKLLYKGYFIAGAVQLVNLINILTAKTAAMPVLYFPSLDRVFGVFVSDAGLLLKCLAYSARLLFVGYFGGAIIGIASGILIGFSKTANYWIMPFVRVIGPIPSTAWIPLVLILFPTATSASTFLIGLAVWFPATIMTSSGISNVENAYFEVSGTLGAGRLTQIFKVGVPAAAPYMFQGIFNGTCSSFITLVTAEMIGTKYGIGWYVNWQKEMLAYANVYAGLIVIAVVFSILITLLFKARDKVLVWQKGVIKW